MKVEERSYVVALRLDGAIWVEGADCLRDLAGCEPEAGRGLGQERFEIGERDVSGAGEGQFAFPAVLAGPELVPAGIFRTWTGVAAEQKEGPVGARGGGGQEAAVQVDAGPQAPVGAHGGGGRCAAQGRGEVAGARVVAR